MEQTTNKTIPPFTYQKSERYSDYYVIATLGNNGYKMNRRDNWICSVIGLDKKEYRTYMMEMFHGTMKYYSNHTRGVHFLNEEDVKAAVKWLEATKILGKLRMIE